MASVLTKSQKRLSSKTIEYDGRAAKMDVMLRYDDQCGNGYNSFSITACVWNKWGNDWQSGGCLHELIAEHFPEYEHLVKWHLVSSVEPMHYLANTLYHVEEGNLDYARSTAVWPDATDEQLRSSNLKDTLTDRLPGLMAEFESVVTDLDFTF